MGAHDTAKALKMREIVYKYIAKHILKHGVGPRFDKMSKELGVHAVTCSTHFSALVQDGRLRLDGSRRYTPHAVRLVPLEEVPEVPIAEPDNVAEDRAEPDPPHESAGAEPGPVTGSHPSSRRVSQRKGGRASWDRFRLDGRGPDNRYVARFLEEKERTFSILARAIQTATLPHSWNKFAKTVGVSGNTIVRHMNALRDEGRVEFKPGTSLTTCGLRIFGDGTPVATPHKLKTNGNGKPHSRQLTLGSMANPIPVKATLAWKPSMPVAVATDPTMEKLLAKKAEFLAKIEFIDQILDSD